MSERSKAVEHDRGCTQMTMGRGCWDDMVASVFVRVRVVVVVVVVTRGWKVRVQEAETKEGSGNILMLTVTGLWNPLLTDPVFFVD